MVTRIRRLALATAILWIGFGAGGWADAGPIALSTPAGLSPGESFRFVFVTDGTTDASSSSIAYYVPSTYAPRLRLIRHRSCNSREYVIPEGITRSRAFRFNVARPPVTPTHPSRGPWLAIGLCCPVGSSLTTASSETLNSSPPLMTSRRGLLHPRKSA